MVRCWHGTMAMFGLIVAGRLVSTTWEQISPTNVVSEIPDADSVNHLVVFLTGMRNIENREKLLAQGNVNILARLHPLP